MVYLIFGNELYLIDKEIKKICDKNSDYELIKIDASSKNFDYKYILDSCLNVGLFSVGSIVLVKDPLFLKKKVEDKALDELIKYCSSPIYENELVFYTYDNDFKKSLTSFKEIKKNAKTIECNINPKTYDMDCKNIYKEKNINLNKKVLDLLIGSSRPSLSLFKQNLELLSLYPDTIDEDATLKLITSNKEEDVYNFINALTRKDITSAFKSLERLMFIDDNVNGLITLLSMQLRFLYEVSYYKEKSFSIEEVMEKTGIDNFYRISIAFRTLNNLNMKEILSLLNKLADLDYKCKTNSDLNDKLKMELFVVSLT